MYYFKGGRNSNLLFFFILMFLWTCVNGDSTEDFEGKADKYQRWKSDGPHFQIVNGSIGQLLGGPRVDATLGTSKGKYYMAKYKSSSTVHWLYSSCFLPSNKRCTVRFSGYLHLEHDEEFSLCTQQQCELCNPIRYHTTCLYQQSFNRTHGWSVIDVPVGFSPVPFDISFGAAFLHPGSFVAIDDIRVMNCQPEEVKEQKCRGDDVVFRCNYTNVCVTRDRICDLYSDCQCGEDEASFCELIPPEGLVTLLDCNLDDGSCLWYNALEEITDESTSNAVHHSHDHSQRYRWRIRNTTEAEIPQTEYYDLYDRKIPYFFQGSFMSVDVPPYPQSSILRSVSLKPRYTGGGLCQVRFHYLLLSRSAQLKLILLEVGKDVHKEAAESRIIIWEASVDEKKEDEDGDVGSTFTKSSEQKNRQWQRIVVDLNTLPINVSYILQFTVKGLSSNSSGQAMIQSLTLGRDCFTPDISLTTCGSWGAKGPSQDMCDSVHRTRQVVNVIGEGREKGVQTWTIPKTQAYRIQAYGARGGWGLHSKALVKNTKGAKVMATFELKAGEQLHFLVGQAGSEACVKNAWNDKIVFCNKNATFVGGGDGGGGGATIVYKKDKKKLNILLVAGGGGGLPFEIVDKTNNDLYEHNDKQRRTFQRSAITMKASAYSDTPSDSIMDFSQAKVLIQGNLKGSAGCSKFKSYWGGSGGFGGGGGACASGGHGGGARGMKYEGSLQHDIGLPGLSYISPEALSHSIEIDSHGSDGLVEIESQGYCPCAYRCMWKGPSLEKPVCLCPKGKVLQKDGYSCDDSVSSIIKNKDNDSYIMPIILAVFVVLAIIVSIICICIYKRHPSMRNGLPVRLKKTTQILCPCLNLNGRPLTFNAHVLPQITNPPAVMHENSIYNRVTTKASDQVLNEIPRKHLKLTGELGQGAFGKVFYGLLSHMPMVEGDLPVAVKTLPAVCTEQTEMDFLLEALIVSKFNHPNIVKFIGTCFDQHPHYLILELLEGGDIKTFLHQARPKREVPSTITMIDLLRLSLDISRGCEHLEEKHFIHRDIAARNCLLTTKGPNRIAKIADFGMARDIYRSDYYKKAGRAMLPVKWMPPEAFIDGIFTSKTDVW